MHVVALDVVSHYVKCIRLNYRLSLLYAILYLRRRCLLRDLAAILFSLTVDDIRNAR